MVACLLMAVAPCLAEEPAPSEFEAAKAKYQTETEKIYEAISVSISKRLEAAQEAGQAQATTIVLAEQKAFGDYRDIPHYIPGMQQLKLIELAKGMDAAYSSEIKNLTKAKKNEEAESLRKEQRDLRQRVAIQNTRKTLLGKWKLQMGNYSSDFTFYPDGTMFHSAENFRGTWQVDPVTQRIIVSPPGGGNGDKINLPLDPKGTSGQSSNGGMFKLTKKK